MATEVGVGYVSIVPSAKGFGRALSNEIGPDLPKVGREAGEQVGDGLADGVEKRTGALRSKMAQFGPAIAAGLGVGVAMLGRDAVRAASDLGESINAVQVTFGEAAGGILALGENAATAVGLSNAEFNGLAVQFSNFATAIAGPGGDVAGVMGDLTGRVADFASVMNLDVPEAAAVFQSAMSGETEPIKRFGIDLSAAAVEAYALANGIGTAGKELTEQEKTVARYGLLMQSTAKTAGDFANTSDGLANKTRIARAQFEDTKATLGEALLPVMAQAAGIAATLLTKFNELSPGTQKVVIAVGLLAAGLVAVGVVLGPIITAFTAFAAVVNLTTLRMIAARIAQAAWSLLFGAFRLGLMAVTAAQWLWNAAMAANPIGLIIAAIALLVGALVLLWKKNETFRQVVTVAWAAIKTVVAGVARWFGETLVPWFRAIFDVWLKVARAYIGFWVAAFLRVRDAVMVVVDWLRGTFWPWWQRIWHEASNVIETVVYTVTRNFARLRNGVEQVVNWLQGTFWPWWQRLWHSASNIVETAIYTFTRNFAQFRAGVERIAGFIQSVFDRWRSGIERIWAMFAEFVNRVRNLPGFRVVFNALGFANGGLIPGSGSGDRVPMMGEPGEFVIRKSAVQSVGVQSLSALNATGQMPAAGGVTVENLTINNPVAERASESLPRTVRRLAYAGGLA